MIYPDGAVRDEECECFEALKTTPLPEGRGAAFKVKIVQDWFQWCCQPHKEAGFHIEGVAWNYIDRLTDRYQVVRVEARFVRVRQVERRPWDFDVGCLREIVL